LRSSEVSVDGSSTSSRREGALDVLTADVGIGVGERLERAGSIDVELERLAGALVARLLRRRPRTRVIGRVVSQSSAPALP
jgi:hypothetical protein